MTVNCGWLSCSLAACGAAPVRLVSPLGSPDSTPRTPVSPRFYCSPAGREKVRWSVMAETVVYFEEVSDSLKRKIKIAGGKAGDETAAYMLIDVRNVGELEKHGKIKDAINIPLKLMETILSMADETFFNEMGFEKRLLAERVLVPYCRSGPRAFKAATVMKSCGYHR